MITLPHSSRYLYSVNETNTQFAKFGPIFYLSESGSSDASALTTRHSSKSSSRSETSDIGTLESDRYVIPDKYADNINSSEEGTFSIVSNRADRASLLSELNTRSGDERSQSRSDIDSLNTIRKDNLLNMSSVHSSETETIKTRHPSVSSEGPRGYEDSEIASIESKRSQKRRKSERSEHKFESSSSGSLISRESRREAT